MTLDLPISERTLGELLPYTLTYSLCIHIDKGTEVWVVAGMLVQYLESATDSVMVRDGEKQVGTLGVEDIMEPNPVTVTEDTKYKDLMKYWKERGRAYAVMANEWGFYSAISSKKILEIGMRGKTNLSIMDLPKKIPITFKKDDTLGAIIDSMFKNKTRKILLENSNKYLNDRIIIETITEKMKYLKDTDDFLNMPARIIELEEARVIFDDLQINEVSAMMYDMEHPYVIYKDWIVTPWDICNVLLSKEITKYTA